MTRRSPGLLLGLVAALILAMGAATAVGQVSLGGPDAPPAPDPAPSNPAPRAPSRATPDPPASDEPSAAEREAERQAELAEQRREARQAALERKRELAAQRAAEAERKRLAAIERREAAERRQRQEAALSASRELEANGTNALPSASQSDDGGRWRLVAIALLVVAGITGTLSLFPAAARRYDMQGTRGVALLTRHRLELGTLCVGTLATLLLVQLLT